MSLFNNNPIPTIKEVSILIRTLSSEGKLKEFEKKMEFNAVTRFTPNSGYTIIDVRVSSFEYQKEN